jgi:bifunctional non-homologous end joining protein LigD
VVGERQRVRVDGRELAVSSLDKVLYPATGTTKADVLRYYLGVAEVMLPHLAGRPVTLRRFPEGVAADSFYQKTCPEGRPGWIATVPLGREGREKVVQHCDLAEPAALAWAAQQGGLEIHVPMGRGPDPTVPTAVVFDLDPGPPADVLDCAWLALRMREAFDHLGLVAVPKTSGGKGLQLYVPVNRPDTTYEQTRAFSHALALTFERLHPDRVVSVQTKALRPGKVLIDWSQNHLTKTTVCAYSLRGRERPTVSTPLTWEEVEAADAAGDAERLRCEYEDVLTRVAAHGDRFATVATEVQSLPPLQPPADRS